ncbi:MAG: helicase [Propionibacteriaceae bacterium]|nr:helicase [Propionibacteriaceae bacterium]
MAPSGAKARYRANVEALRLAQQLHTEGRAATAEEQQVLARWSSWGALPEVFDATNQAWQRERDELHQVLGDQGWDAARRTTLNAHYTSPELVHEIWEAVTRLGLSQGRVLEPGCGSGTFIGAAPAGVEMVGVELDPATAQIAQALYPQATIRSESFAESRFPTLFDGVIGNVPFGDIALHDPIHNPNRHSIHNHFILKSLALTAPGGVMAVVTSRFTLDATNPAARREMYAHADLVGAVRLPTGAHRRSAGTDAVTDLLIFRRRIEGETPQPFTWETTTPLPEQAASPIRVNTYFHTHPDHVLGRFEVGQGMHNADTLHVLAPDLAATSTHLHHALEQITETAHTIHLTYQHTTPAPQSLGAAEVEPTSLWDGTVVQHEGHFHTVKAGRLERLKVPATQQAELGALLQLRDVARDLLQREATTTGGDRELEQVRTQALTLYRSYVDTYGPLNRVTMRPTGREEPVVDALTGEQVVDPVTQQPQTQPRYARIQPPVRRFLRSDPHAPLVYALEVFDEQTATAEPAALLTKRVLVPRPEPQGADNIEDALAITLNRTGEVDVAAIADLLGSTIEDTRPKLAGLVFDDPVSGKLIHAPEYLSGNVREKLDAARHAAAADPDRYTPNVTALQRVLPDPLGPADIHARLGSVWISPQIHQDFLRDLLNDRTLTVENPLSGTWNVTGRRHGIRATQEWGTPRLSAPEIAEALMDQRPIEIKDKIEDREGRTKEVLNPVETAAAQAKAEALQERFSEWVWEDPARATALTTEYNRRFNSLVLRDYTDAGTHLRFPGLALNFTLHPHQRTAVARMLSEPTVGLFHQVGAGKTLEMIVGATELKRTGMITKPAVVVPNHMLEQFSREWLQAYPAARILAASSDDLRGENRRLFVARAATNDWDAVILTQEAFKRISLSPQAQSTYITNELATLRTHLEQTRQDRHSSRSIKQIEKTIATREQELRKLLDSPKDPGVHWEDTGIDYLLVDEAHMYKNLTTPSDIPGAAIDGSKKSSDLHLKLEWLRSRHGTRVATLATATPLANSVTEAHVMQRYLRPDLLRDAGVESFDAWAATFGKVVTEMEMNITGGFRLKSRFASFTNVPEMLRMWHTFADVKTSQDLNLDVPQIAPRPSDGKRETETIVLPPSPELVAFIKALGDRADLVAARMVPPHEDNMLTITNDGRKAALDMRLLDENHLPTSTVKLDLVARQITHIWNQTRTNTYLDASGNPSPTPGALQLVFCDLGTPNKDRWDAYTELKHLLTDNGIPAHTIRFMHEANNDADKARLFAAARSGHIQVLIGSTAKMGVGTNVQNRLVAMHHIDCPWRPADLEQRDGRGIRQGNQNPEVAIYRYVTERSFDAYSWQTVARKAHFISQIMNGRLDVREIEDIGDTALSAAEAKALASGNPLLLERANAENTFQKLRREKVAHDRSQAALTHALTETNTTLASERAILKRLETAATRTTPTHGDNFAITINGHTITSRTEAVDALAHWAATNPDWDNHRHTPIPIGQLGGHTITAYAATFKETGSLEPQVVLELKDVPLSRSHIPIHDFRTPTLGTIRTLENKVTAITRHLTDTRATITRLEDETTQILNRLGLPFPKQDQLDAAHTHLTQLDKRLHHTHPSPTTRNPTHQDTRHTPTHSNHPHPHHHTPNNPSPNNPTPNNPTHHI